MLIHSHVSFWKGNAWYLHRPNSRFAEKDIRRRNKKNEHVEQVLYHSQTPHVQGLVVTDNVSLYTAEYRHDNPTNIA